MILPTIPNLPRPTTVSELCSHLAILAEQYYQTPPHPVTGQREPTREATNVRCALNMLMAVARDKRIRALVEEHAPDRIVIEWPSGKTGTGAKRGAKGALATYGAAAGVVYAYAAQLLPGRVAAVTERQWTRGRGSKPKRRQVVASVYRSYDATLDPGGDLADAIGLARWCLEDPQRCGLDVARNEVKHA